MVNYSAVFLVASIILGQAVRGAELDDFAKLHQFHGSWEATDVASQGQTLRVSVSWKPVLEGHFIEHHWKAVDQAGNEPPFGGVVLLGRDPADNRVRGWGFENRGDLMVMELTGWDGNMSNWATTIISRDGTVLKSEANSFELLDENRYAWMLAIVDGEKSEAVFKRVPEEKPLWPDRGLEAPEDLDEQLSDIAWWAGDFSMEGSDAFTRKTLVGHISSGWVLDGRFLQLDQASVDSDQEFHRYRAVLGIDPATGKTTGWEFDSSGAVGKFTVSEKGQNVLGQAASPEAGHLEFKGRMTKTPDGIEYRATGDLPGGKKTNYHSVLKKRD